ncbi:TRAP-type mannitol/chloroaromatic compound transport system permease small subunit [Defluviimonas denitrificans]|jgi:TRAP-type mannitol/chloroaromatic compound transport system permease small subunit|uniref:TRAP transporter small permease protein n=1 Tax=Albidovulum denitrificans TaxID=404881 RepID=A0A2S8S419_9RHOB|nr:TRAP transporter small permease subunit [Defluviimonas denitrificans]PQV55542.1 TRAP-type mannitol/chloroaromatic compound transport system permease small subunit [Defluviimonas denitrificans]
MPNWIKAYVRFVDALNYRVGRFSMYLLFVLMGILLWSSISNILRQNAIWTLEMAQFTMVAYYMLGGPYSLQLDSNVRMDLLYHRWSDRTKAWFDAFSVFALLFYLGVLLYGAVESTIYSLEYAERSPTAWRPYIAPIKIIMCVGIFLMLLQAIAFFFKDVAKLRGEEL